jgi:hypothetical protein
MALLAAIIITGAEDPVTPPVLSLCDIVIPVFARVKPSFPFNTLGPIRLFDLVLYEPIQEVYIGKIQFDREDNWIDHYLDSSRDGCSWHIHIWPKKSFTTVGFKMIIS